MGISIGIPGEGANRAQLQAKLSVCVTCGMACVALLYLFGLVRSRAKSTRLTNPYRSFLVEVQHPSTGRFDLPMRLENLSLLLHVPSHPENTYDRSSRPSCSPECSDPSPHEMSTGHPSRNLHYPQRLHSSYRHFFCSTQKS
jgi:hypothetical protein